MANEKPERRGYRRDHELFDPNEPEINFSALKTGFPFYANIFSTPFKVNIDNQDYVGNCVESFYQALTQLQRTKDRKKNKLSDAGIQMILSSSYSKPCRAPTDKNADILKDLLRCKFTQNPALLAVLLRNNAKIVSDKNKTNPNLLGRLLMELRADFRIELGAYSSIRVLMELTWPVCNRLELIYTHPKVIRKMTTDMLEHISQSPSMRTFLIKRKLHAQDYAHVKDIQFLNFSLSKISLDIIQAILDKSAKCKPYSNQDKALLKNMTDFLLWLKDILDEQTNKNQELQTLYAKNNNFHDRMTSYKQYMEWTKHMQEEISKREIMMEAAIDEYIHTPVIMSSKLASLIAKTFKKHQIQVSYSCPMIRLKLLQDLDQFIQANPVKNKKNSAKSTQTQADYWLAVSLHAELKSSKQALLRDIFSDENIKQERAVLGASSVIRAEELSNIVRLAKKNFEPEV